MVRSGNRLEVSEYKEPISYGEPPACVGKNSGFREKTEEEKVFLRHVSSRRSKQTFTRLAYSNSYEWPSIKGKFIKPTLLTLTFKENIQNIKEANLEFTKFLKRLNYEITGRKTSFLKYATVIEFQKRGAIHYHVLFFNYSYIPKERLTELWRQGFVDIERVKGKSIKETIGYLVKYMVKGLENDKLAGQKSYFASRDLKKPIITRNQERNSFFLNLYKEDLILAKEFEKNYKSEYCGDFNYSIYDLGKNEKLKKGIIAFEDLLRYNE